MGKGESDHFDAVDFLPEAEGADDRRYGRDQNRDCGKRAPEARRAFPERRRAGHGVNEQWNQQGLAGAEKKRGKVRFCSVGLLAGIFVNAVSPSVFILLSVSVFVHGFVENRHQAYGRVFPRFYLPKVLD